MGKNEEQKYLGKTIIEQVKEMAERQKGEREVLEGQLEKLAEQGEEEL